MILINKFLHNIINFLGETTTQLDLSKAFDNIKEGKFLDPEKQKAWDALPIVQKNEIIKFALEPKEV